MDRHTLTRAWRDPVFRAGLPVSTLTALPAHPAGEPIADKIDWTARFEAITLTDGCGTAGHSQVICTCPCLGTTKN
jgi:mersacidin/lichenicidin family type 2 lantibiotic